MKRFKFKMLIVLMLCACMTLSMFVYMLRMPDKCENSVDEMCGHLTKKTLYRAAYVFYDVRSSAIDQLMKPSGPSADTRKTPRTAERHVQKFNFTMSPLGRTPHDESRLHDEGRKQSNYKHPSTTNKPNGGGSGGGEDVYETRRKHLQKVCLRFFDLSGVEKLKKIKLNHILIDEKHKVLYCYVPKVACTNWKRIFLVLTGKVSNMSEVVNLPASQVHGKNLFKSLQNYSVAEILNMTGDYTKFIFVRHPFERLLSAYRNKLEQHYDSSKYFQARFGKFIIKKFRKNPTNVSLARGDDVTFAEFVRYLLSSNPRHYNEHWQRVTDLCHPCLIGYDFIGKYDSLLKDSNHLLKRFGLTFEFPVMTKPSTTYSNLKRYYNTLETNTIYRLYKIYEMDFRLFGYDLFNMSEETPRSSALPVR